MEIKVHCPCGQKFAFDAVPVKGQMPHAVTCPACGEDGTALANEYMRQQIATQAAPVATLVNETPVAAAAAPPPPAPAPAPPGGLRINRPAHADTPPPPPAGAPPPPRPMPQYANAPLRQPQKSKNPAPTIIAIVVVFAVLGFGAWKMGRKVMRFVNDVKDVASEFEKFADMKWNFEHEDSVVLYIQHTNHVAVAEACKDYWRDTLKRPLTGTEGTDEQGIGAKEYGVYENYNGWVRIIGALEWPAAEFEPLCQHLSQKFGGLAFETSESDFSGAYHFGVYEAGARKFHARMEVKIKKDDYDEVVTTEGDEYALAHGFKPGEEGFKAFNILDADQMTQNLGMKIWDEPEGRVAKMILLKEATK